MSGDLVMGKRIHIVRHSESFKNIKDKHGGNGESLTSNGIQSCKINSRHIERMLYPGGLQVISGNALQAVESASCYSSHFKTMPIVNSCLNGLNLGVISGLTNSEAKEKYPSDFSKMEMWRKGELNISDLNFTKGESFLDFHKRIDAFLTNEIKKDGNSVIVCTTSVYIMILNIMLMKDDFRDKAYRNFTVPLGAYTCLEINNNFVSVLEFNRVPN